MCEHAVVDACIKGGASVLFVRCEQFQPFGLSVVAVLAESHATLHTYPEHGVCMIDVFTCGETINPDEIAHMILLAVGCRRHGLAQKHRRGVW